MLFSQVSSYRAKRDALSMKEVSGQELTERESREREQYNYAIRALAQETQETYTLAYLSDDGYFPGYALTRDSCVARCLRPYVEIWRAQAVALREFTPANWIYAAGEIYGVRRVDFFGFGTAASDTSRDVQRREMLYDAEHERVVDLEASDVEGLVGDEFASFRLGGVELRQRQHIDDSDERRRHVGQDIVGTFLGQHRGGESGHVGGTEWRLYRKGELRLVNLGPLGRERDGRPIGFPVCGVCGAVRSPFASEAEIEKFEEYHRDSCGGQSTQWSALHVDFDSDLLMLGPFQEYAEAINLMEATLVGAREFLDMGESELEGFVEVRDGNSPWVMIYDPMPGGSGFLPQLRRFWAEACRRGLDVLGACECEEACYSCLKSYWNQRHHSLLSRPLAVQLLQTHAAEMEFGAEIPPEFGDVPSPGAEEESDAEELFMRILSERHFPLPTERQYRVQLADGTHTVADFAYPAETVLVYIDGMSPGIHGSRGQQQRDRITRAKLRHEGYRVVEHTAEALHDTVAVDRMLEELAVYLGREDLLDG